MYLFEKKILFDDFFFLRKLKILNKEHKQIAPQLLNLQSLLRAVRTDVIPRKTLVKRN